MTADVKMQGTQLQALLRLELPPVAIAFRDKAPDGVSRIPSPAPAGCGYWKLAAEGKIFYTEAADHYTCPVGAHTHGIELPAAVAQELQGLIHTMVQMQYIRLDEIPSIPHRREPFRVAVYAPLSAMPCAPDVVLVRGTVKQMMLLAEAAQAAGIASGGATLGRPTCAILPQALQTGQAASSFGCIGNRVYTGLGDDEGYSAIPGPQVGEVVEKLAVMVEANRTLESFHRGRVSR